MKKTASTILFALFLLLSIGITQVAFAQESPPPPSEKGSDGNRAPGGGAPVDGGIISALVMVAGYGAWKFMKSRRESRLAD